MRTISIIAGAILLGGTLGAFSQSATNQTPPRVLQATKADAAWQELQAAMHIPPPPAQWSVNQPTPEERKDFYLPFVLSVASLAKDFYTKFPHDSHALTARLTEADSYNIAASLGRTNFQSRAESLEKQILSDPTLPEADRFHLRQQQVERAANAAGINGPAAAIAAYSSGLRDLRKEFPHNPQVWQMMLNFAPNLDEPQAKVMLRDVAASPDAPQELQQAATDQLKKFDLVGRPLQLQFTSLDGGLVDLAQMKGKVVLVDFWATWCGPCVHELPDVKAAYDTLHGKGFNIVGISLDTSKSALSSFVASHEMPWPQYYDGLQWSNKFAQEFAIQSIPTMWLVDKRGILRDFNARADLTGKIEKLLAE